MTKAKTTGRSSTATTPSKRGGNSISDGGKTDDGPKVEVMTFRKGQLVPSASIGDTGEDGNSIKYAKPPASDISPEEQWRLFQQSGLINKIPKPPKKASASKKSDNDDDDSDDSNYNSDDDEGEYNAQMDMPGMDALLYTLPFTGLFGVFDTLVQQQYNQEVTFPEIFMRMMKFAPAFYVILYIFNRYSKLLAMQVVLFAIASVTGTYFVYLNLNSPAIGVMRRAPGLGTIWIMATMFLELKGVVASIAAVLIVYYMDFFRQKALTDLS